MSYFSWLCSSDCSNLWPCHRHFSPQLPHFQPRLRLIYKNTTPLRSHFTKKPSSSLTKYTNTWNANFYRTSVVIIPSCMVSEYSHLNTSWNIVVLTQGRTAVHIFNIHSYSNISSTRGRHIGPLNKRPVNIKQGQYFHTTSVAQTLGLEILWT